MQEHIAGLLDNFGDQMDNVDEVAHVVLKGHLLIEEWLTHAINQHLFHPEHLIEEGRLSFIQKLTLARSLDLRRNNLGMWDLIAAVNSLRNDLAHSLNSPKRVKKMEALKRLYFRETSAHQNVEQTQQWTDARLLRSICAVCLGFLSESARNSFEFGIIHSLDRQNQLRPSGIQASSVGGLNRSTSAFGQERSFAQAAPYKKASLSERSGRLTD